MCATDLEKTESANPQNAPGKGVRFRSEAAERSAEAEDRTVEKLDELVCAMTGVCAPADAIGYVTGERDIPRWSFPALLARAMADAGVGISTGSDLSGIEAKLDELVAVGARQAAATEAIAAAVKEYVLGRMTRAKKTSTKPESKAAPVRRTHADELRARIGGRAQ